MDEIKNKGGRPTKYLSGYAAQAYKLCLLGLTDIELANFFEVDEGTVINWRAKKKEFADACKKGKTIADAEIAESYFKRAKGYDYLQETFEKIDGKVNLQMTDGSVIVQDAYRKKVVTMHLAADPGAALSWLKNRQRDKWKDKTDISIDFEKMSDAQLDEIIKRLTNKVKENIMFKAQTMFIYFKNFFMENTSQTIAKEPSWKRQTQATLPPKYLNLVKGMSKRKPRERKRHGQTYN